MAGCSLVYSPLGTFNQHGGVPKLTGDVGFAVNRCVYYGIRDNPCGFGQLVASRVRHLPVALAGSVQFREEGGHARNEAAFGGRH